MLEYNVLFACVCFLFGFIFGYKTRSTSIMEVYSEGFLDGTQQTVDMVRNEINNLKNEDKKETIE
jgi:hypothetical protein